MTARTSVRMSFQAVPDSIDVDKVRAYLEGLAGVKAIHDLHIWSMSTTEVAHTGHLVIPGEHPGDALLMGNLRGAQRPLGGSVMPHCRLRSAR
jgi:cobalt-zinc-cadmium efflux system protein